MPKDGIEIHFDEQRGYLELACEPDAFASYRDLARDQLKDLPEIPINEVIEMNIIDMATFVARREAPKRRIGGLAIAVAVVIILPLALIGAYAVIKRFFP
jgi:hypothetical protein